MTQNNEVSGKPDRPKGRKPRTEGVKLLDDVSSLAALRTLAAVREQKGWSYATAARKITEYGTTDAAIAYAQKAKVEPDYAFDDNTIYRAIREGKPPYDAASKAIWLWATSQHEALYLDLHMQADLVANEGLVSALKEALGHGSDFDFAKIAAFSGIYKLYRPHHQKPKDAILISRLIIGEREARFDCRLETCFEDEFGEESRNIAEGKIVPHGPRLMALISSPPPSRSNFILHFDEIDHRLESESGVRGMGGIMLSAAGSVSASAWPIYARRVKESESFEPHVIPASGYAELPVPVRERLDRGAVYWHPRDFPKPFEQGD